MINNSGLQAVIVESMAGMSSKRLQKELAKVSHMELFLPTRTIFDIIL